MQTVVIKEKDIRDAAAQGLSEFVDVVVGAINGAVGGSLTSETMAELNSDQITLLAYDIMRKELMEGGFVQLIYNGYGPFIFKNPFARALKEWGLLDLGKLVQKAHKCYGKYHETIESAATDEEFMALYEKCPELDEFDDEFVDNEDTFTSQIAYYVDGHIQNFVTVEQ